MLVSTSAKQKINKNALTDYTRNCNIFIIFLQNTSVLYTVWRGILHAFGDLVRFRFAAIVIDVTLLSQR